MVKMEDLNYHVCSSGIAWWQALHSGLKEEIKDRISFSKITPNDDAEYKLLLKQVGCAYERHLQEKHHHNDHQPKDKKNNQRKRDDDDDKGNQGKKNFEKGSDSKKPRTEKKGPKPANVDKAGSPERYSRIFVGSKNQAQRVQALWFLGASMGIL
jgi:hypothetical protein